ncbi:hypothetical protein GGI42DRAFT_310630, partial [Trichoderma sp. SZMC 28013]
MPTIFPPSRQRTSSISPVVGVDGMTRAKFVSYAKFPYHPPTPSFLPENESDDSIHSRSGAQQDSFPGYNRFDTRNLPHSLILDPAHLKDESQQQPCIPASTKTTAGSCHEKTSRHCCHVCKKSFVNNSFLKRDFETSVCVSQQGYSVNIYARLLFL